MLMDKKAIKDFAVNAREKLRSDVTRKLVKLVLRLLVLKM